MLLLIFADRVPSNMNLQQVFEELKHTYFMLYSVSVPLIFVDLFCKRMTKSRGENKTMMIAYSM